MLSMAWNPEMLYLKLVSTILLVVLNLSVWRVHGGGRPLVPCYFIFGASAYDNGNNNDLPTVAKANYQPYGIDFPQGNTGRFTNGRTISDILVEFLGFRNEIPSFATARGRSILQGVNYASGSSGIRNETGQDLGVRISMDCQLQNHQIIVSEINEIMRNKDLATKYLSKCLYSVGMGTNDYVNNYLRPLQYPTSRIYTPQQYAIELNRQFSQQLKTLYSYGARKVVLFGIPPLGCSPAVIAAAAGGADGSPCVDLVNNFVQLFNTELRSLVDDLNGNLTGANFVYVNTYQIYSTLSSDFRVTNAPCCRVSPITALCIPLSNPCGNRSEYIWWDGSHQTEAASVVIATRSYTSQSPLDAYPIDICWLAQL